MATSSRSNPGAAESASELQIIRRFRRLLGIRDPAELRTLQIALRHVIFITPTGRGRSKVRYEGATDILLVSRQPLLDAARLLIRIGCRADAIIAMRRRNSVSDDLRAPLSVAAKFTVDETKTIFAKWKPFSQSAVVGVEASTRKSATITAPSIKSSVRRDRRRADQIEPESLGSAEDEQNRS